MALTNVRHLKSGEWVPVTAEEADRLYHYSVSACGGHFMCYSCYHPVIFVKHPEGRSSHFKHSGKDIDKSCPDRSLNQSLTHSQYLRETITAPMRLYWDRWGRYGVEIGLLPLSIEEMARAERLSAMVTVSNDQGDSIPLQISDNLKPHETYWVRMPIGFARKYHLAVRPLGFAPHQWNAGILSFDTESILFDFTTGKRLPLRADVEANQWYYVLTHLYLFLQSIDGVEGQLECDTFTGGWRLYKVRATKITQDASLFFQRKLQVNLTSRPTCLTPIWPPLLEHDHLVETNASKIWMLLTGDGNVEAYPANEHFITRENGYYNNLFSVLSVYNTGRVQMVWAAKSSVLRFIYLLPLRIEKESNCPEVTMTDNDGKYINQDSLATPPKQHIIKILSDVDGKAQIFDPEGLLYEERINAGEEKRLLDISFGQHIVIRIGCDIVRTLTVKAKQLASMVECTMLPWRGSMIPFDSRYAWLLKEMRPDSQLHKRTLQALQVGSIPSDGLSVLRRVMEEKVHE